MIWRRSSWMDGMWNDHHHPQYTSKLIECDSPGIRIQYAFARVEDPGVSRLIIYNNRFLINHDADDDDVDQLGEVCTDQLVW
jgi:hypothetical protein